MQIPVVALTGGIGSGKSEAAKQFSKLGVPVVDTDDISRALTSDNSPLLPEISRIFGAEFITAEGKLDRTKLRTHIFKHQEERLKLEALMHPAIYDIAIQQLSANANQLNPHYQILVLPLLFENDRYLSLIDQSIAIDCDEQLQVERAMSRSQLSATDVRAMMAAQLPRITRISRADIIIDNNGSLADLEEKITGIHKKFIKSCIVSK
jgi:dephospho-CoA kinase